jgi:hypothetical protein
MNKKTLTRDQLNEIMKLCGNSLRVNYVSPVIHATSMKVVSFKIIGYEKEYDHTSVNSPENYCLYDDIMKTLNELGGQL